MAKQSTFYQEDSYNDKLITDTYSDNTLLEIARTAVFTLDSTFRIKTISASIADLIGYHAKDLIGKSYIDLVAVGFQDAFHRVLITEEKALLDYPIQMKNGDWCWVRHAGQQLRNENTMIYRCLIQDVSH